MPPSDREAAILQRLRQVCEYAYAHSTFYRRKWQEAGFCPSQLKSLEAFEDRVPVVTKAELRASQATLPPFGEYLCVQDSEVFRIHGTSGTTCAGGAVEPPAMGWSLDSVRPYSPVLWMFAGGSCSRCGAI